MALRRYSDEVEQAIDEAATTHGLDRNLLSAVIHQESRGRQDARSPRGAIGVMQLMPETAAELGVDPTDLRQNVDGGARYLRQNLERFGGDLPLALAAYNAGPTKVARLGRVPNFPETQRYVQEITANLENPTAAAVLGPSSDASLGLPDLTPKLDPVQRSIQEDWDAQYKLMEWAATEGGKYEAAKRGKIFKYAADTGMAASTVAANFDSIDAYYRKTGFNLGETLDSHPMLARFVQENPQRAGIVLADPKVFLATEDFLTGVSKILSGDLGAYFDLGHYSTEREKLLARRDVLKVGRPEDDARIAELDRLIEEKGSKTRPGPGANPIIRGLRGAASMGGGLYESAEDYKAEIGILGLTAAIGTAIILPEATIGATLLAGAKAGMATAGSAFWTLAGVDMGLAAAGKFYEESRYHGVPEDDARRGAFLVGAPTAAVGIFAGKAMGLAGESVSGPLLTKYVHRYLATYPGRAFVARSVAQVAEGSAFFAAQNEALGQIYDTAKLKYRLDLEFGPDSANTGWWKAYLESRWGVDPETGIPYSQTVRESAAEGALLGAFLAFPGAVWKGGSAYRAARTTRDLKASILEVQARVANEPMVAEPGVMGEAVSHMQDQQREQSGAKGFTRETYQVGWQAPADRVQQLLDIARWTMKDVERIMPDVARQLRDARDNPGMEISISDAHLLDYFLMMDKYADVLGDHVHAPGTLSAWQSEAWGKFLKNFQEPQKSDPARLVYEDIYTKQVEAGRSNKEALNNTAIEFGALSALAQAKGVPIEAYYKQQHMLVEDAKIAEQKRTLLVQRALQYGAHPEEGVRQEAFIRAAKDTYGEREIPTYRVVPRGESPSEFTTPAPKTVARPEGKPKAWEAQYTGAVDWARGQETVTAKSLREQFKFSKSDANAILARMEEEGVLGPSSHEGRKVIQKEKPAPTPAAPAEAVDPRVQKAEDSLKAAKYNLEDVMRTLADDAETVKIHQDKVREAEGYLRKAREAAKAPKEKITYVLRSGDHYLNLDDAVRDAAKNGGEILVVNVTGADIRGVKPGKVILGEIPHERIIQGPAPIPRPPVKEGDVRAGYVDGNALRTWFKRTLTEDANLYTYLHESSHVWAELLQRDAEAGHAGSALMYAKMQKILGAEGVKLTDAHHEQFARMFERYIAEGKAPSPDLVDAFRSFKHWALTVYKSLDNMEIKGLMPEAREFFDRLIVADESIKAKERQLHLIPMISVEDAKKFGLDPKKVNSLHTLWQELPDKLRDEMAARFEAAALEARKKDAGTVKDLIAKRDNLYNVLAWLTEGRRPDGKEMAFKGVPRIDPESLKSIENLPPAAMEMLHPFLLRGGWSIDEIAIAFDFPSGKRMVERILQAGANKERYLGARVREELATRHPAIGMDPAWVEAESLRAMYESKEFKSALEAEFEYLSNRFESKRKVKATPIFAQIEAMAQQEVRSMNYLMSDPIKYRVASGKARAEAHSANFHGDYQRAYTAKISEIYNHYMMKAAQEQRARFEKIRDLADVWSSKRLRERIGKVGDGEYLVSLEAMLTGVGFTRIPLNALQRAETLKAFVASEVAAGRHPPDIPPEYLDPSRITKNYKLMTGSELEAWATAVSTIVERAKTVGKLELQGRFVSLDNHARMLAELGLKNLDAIKPGTEKDTKLQELRRRLKDGYAYQANWEFITNSLDGEIAGPWHEAIFQPMDLAQGKEELASEATHKRLGEVYNRYYTEDKARIAQEINFGGFEMTFGEVLKMACMVGDEGTFRHLVESHANILRELKDPSKPAEWWTKENVFAEIDRLLEKKDWDTVFAIAREFEIRRPEVERLHRKESGSNLKVIHKRPIETRHGQVHEGWYFPLEKDRDALKVDDTSRGFRPAEETVRAIEEKKPVTFANDFAFRNVSHTFTLDRTINATPVKPNLDFGTIPNLLREVDHYLAFYEPIENANRLFSHPEIQKTIERVFGKDMYKFAFLWLENLARDGNIGAYMDKGARTIKHFRTGASVVSLAGKMSTGLLQGQGIFNNFKELGVHYTMEGVKKFLGDLLAGHPFREVSEMTTEIRFLDKHWDRDYGDLHKMIENDWYHGARRVRNEWVIPWSMSVFWAMQKSMNVIAWRGAYAKAAAEGHTNPIMYANNIMRRAQSDGGLKSMSRVMMGTEKEKAWNFMYTYWSSVYNQMFERMPKDAALDKKIFILAHRTMWLIAMPTVATMLVKGQLTDDRTSGWEKADALLWNTLGYTTRMFPTTRALVLQGALEALHKGGARNPKPIAFIDIGARGAASTFKGVRTMATGEGSLSRADWMNLGKLTGMTLHLPVNGVINTWDYIDKFPGMQDPALNFFVRSPSEYK